MTFAERLRYYREKAGYSQKEIAEIVNIPFQTYNNYETKGAQPKIEILIKLAHALHVDVNALVGYQQNETAAAFHLLERAGVKYKKVSDDTYYFDMCDFGTVSTQTIVDTVNKTKQEIDHLIEPKKLEVFNLYFGFNLINTFSIGERNAPDQNGSDTPAE